MISKKRIVRMIDILYWVIILVSTVLEVIKNFMGDSFNWSELSQMTVKEIILVVLGIIALTFVCFIGSIFKYLKLTFMYVGVRIAIRVAYKEKLDKDDLEKGQEYYRDIIDKFSPAVLNYIDNFTIDKNTVIATLMGLEMKKILNDKLEIINDDFSKLDENEKYICENIDKLKNINLLEYEEIIIQDCKSYKLIKEKNILNKGTLNISRTKAIIIVVIFIAILMSFINNSYLVIFTIALLIFFLFLSVFAYYIMTYVVLNMNNPYIRTSEAKKINKKLEGLKKYLNDYTDLQNKSKEELLLWEDYLIYTVIFNQNKKIIKEFEEKIF